MALELEEKIMSKIGLGMNYRWFNGSGSCRYLANNAVELLPSALSEEGLTLSNAWKSRCEEALSKDLREGGIYSLTSTWQACSNAIRDAMERGGKI
jgi:hypothetical protein